VHSTRETAIEATMVIVFIEALFPAETPHTQTHNKNCEQIPSHIMKLRVPKGQVHRT
jgi:hypothetical protein